MTCDQNITQCGTDICNKKHDCTCAEHKCTSLSGGEVRCKWSYLLAGFAYTYMYM